MKKTIASNGNNNPGRSSSPGPGHVSKRPPSTFSEVTMNDVLQGVINKGVKSNVLSQGKSARGPIRTADLIYECMIGVALELTNHLPQMFEYERQKYEKQKKLLYQIGNKGKYTDSYGWDKKRENKLEFSFSPVFHHYFNRIIVPFLGGEKKGWHEENSAIWKRIKKVIIDGDKIEIAKLQKDIKNQILMESGKKIRREGVGGSDNKGTK